MVLEEVGIDRDQINLQQSSNQNPNGTIGRKVGLWLVERKLTQILLRISIDTSLVKWKQF